jgi:hypothetical protein
MMTDKQIREAVKYCTFNYARTTPYCRICPYVNFDSICVKILRSDIIKFMDRAIAAKEEK